MLRMRIICREWGRMGPERWPQVRANGLQDPARFLLTGGAP